MSGRHCRIHDCASSELIFFLRRVRSRFCGPNPSIVKRWSYCLWERLDRDHACDNLAAQAMGANIVPRSIAINSLPHKIMVFKNSNARRQKMRIRDMFCILLPLGALRLECLAEEYCRESYERQDCSAEYRRHPTPSLKGIGSTKSWLP